MGIYAADGSINVSVVDGTTLTGRYAADGSLNIVLSDGSSLVGVNHPCGAMWATVTDSSTPYRYAPDGSIYVTTDAGSTGPIRVTPVSGSLGSLERFSAVFAGQSLAEYPFIRGTPRAATVLASDLRTLFGFTGGTITVYASGDFIHDGTAESAEDWTVRLDNLASGGSALLDVSQAGSQIASGNYWWNTQDNTAATSDPLNTINTPGPLWRALITHIETRVIAGRTPNAFVWSQGTTDMTADPGLLTTYEATLRNLFAAVRTAAEVPTLPIFILRLGRHQTATDAGAENIRAIQRTIAGDTAGVYFGAEEYPYRMAVVASHTVGLTSGSATVTIADSTGLANNDAIEGTGIPVGSYVTGLVANTSFTLSRRVNGAQVPSLATVTNAAATVYRMDNVHLYPGSDGVQPLDTAGNTTHNGTDGFYAVLKTLGRRVADIFNVGGVTASAGPRITGLQAITGANKVRVTLAHTAGTDFTVGDTTGWRVVVDGAAVGLNHVVKVNSTTVDVYLSAPLSGTTATVQYGYGAMNQATYTSFILDNASPVAFPMQEIAAVSDTIDAPVSGGGTVAISNTAGATSVSGTDAASYTFAAQSLGSAAADRRIYIGVCARGAATPSILSVTVAGVVASPIGTITHGSTLSRTSLYVADVPTGTTGDVVVTFTATVLRCGIGLWRVTGANSFAVSTQVATSTADPATANLTIPANGGAIGYGFTSHSTPLTHAWTGMTEEFDSVVETNFTHTGASTTTTGAVSVSCDVSATPANGDGFVFVCLTP